MRLFTRAKPRSQMEVFDSVRHDDREEEEDIVEGRVVELVGARAVRSVHERVPLLVEEALVQLEVRERDEGGLAADEALEPAPLAARLGRVSTEVAEEASMTRRHDEFAALGATLPQLRTRKVVCIPLLIPQPD